MIKHFKKLLGVIIAILIVVSSFSPAVVKADTIYDIPTGDSSTMVKGVSFDGVTYDVNSILEVEVKVNSTGKVHRQVIKGQYTEMTDEEIDAGFKELSYLKIHPRDQEENRLLLLRAERLYEEALGMDREMLESEVRKFELALNSQDKRIIEKERKKLKEFLDKWEEER